MNDEIKELIQAVKQSSEPVQTVVDSFFASIVWSPLKAEWDGFSPAEKAFLIAKLTSERRQK